MSQGELVKSYRDVHARLVTPANAVFDHGIDLKRKRKAPKIYLSAPIPTPIVELAKALDIEGPPIVLDPIYNEISTKIQALVAEADELLKKLEVLCTKHQNIIQSKGLSIRAIQETVADYYDFSRSEMMADRRDKHVVKARHVAIYLAKTLTKMSLPALGKFFGGRDHTTILHAARKIEETINTDLALREDIVNIVEELKKTAPNLSGLR